MRWQPSFTMVVMLSVAPVTGGAMLITSDHVSAAEVQTSFSKQVLPIFKDNCVSCHQPGAEGYEKSGLDLTNYQGVMKGTKYGPTVIPGNPEASNLMWLLDWRASPDLRMPHGKGQLPIKFRDTIRHWIQQGAKNN
jgi:Planctomycete cytochrome C